MNTTAYRDIAALLDRVEHLCSEMTFGKLTLGDGTAKIGCAVDEIREELLRGENSDGCAKAVVTEKMFREGQLAMARAFGDA